MEKLKLKLESQAKSYQKLLQAEGYGAKDPKWDDRVNTWDIEMKYEGNTLLIMLDVDDADLVRVVLPNFWEVKPEQLGQALIAADITNKTSKGAKVILSPPRTNTIAGVDFLDDGGQITAPLLIRYVRMVMNAAKTYAKNFEEQEIEA